MVNKYPGIVLRDSAPIQPASQSRKLTASSFTCVLPSPTFTTVFANLWRMGRKRGEPQGSFCLYILLQPCRPCSNTQQLTYLGTLGSKNAEHVERSRGINTRLRAEKTGMLSGRVLWEGCVGVSFEAQ